MTRSGLTSDIVVTSTGQIGLGDPSSPTADIRLRGHEIQIDNGSGVNLEVLLDLQGAGGIGLFTEEDLMVIGVNGSAVHSL